MGQRSKLTEKEFDDVFRFFNEIGIVAQLSRTMFEKELPAGIQVIHFSVLNNLVRLGDGKLPSDLARAFQLPRSNMTDVLSRLEAKGYIVFKPNPRDARSKTVHITSSGIAFRLKAIQAFRGPTRDLSQKFDIKKMAKIHPALAELSKALDALRDGR